MTATELLKQFADPNVIHSLPMMDKLLAGLITTFLGMGITFFALIILQVIISWMDRLINRTSIGAAKSPAVTAIPASAPAATNLQDDQELVAVLTAAIAMTMKTSVGNIVIRNIEKIEDHSPAWNRAGIIEQMNSRF
ncbi:MAG: sodium pump decarboxylase, gamma subunit [uncultured bacterium]|nr:MAG: sodium pump decarboxylase, gamma subunit [uncultured bacterium]